jgi:hypothetical protein
MTPSQRARLDRIEAALKSGRVPRGRCPSCPPLGPLPIVEVDRSGALLAGELPKRCSRCGGPHGEITVVEVVRSSPLKEPM